MGAMTVEFRGEELTLQQMSPFLQENDRDLRREAYDLIVKRRAQDTEKLEDLFDEMLKLRVKIAKNADCADYREYMFRAYERFDYTPKECFEFHDGVEEVVIPLSRKILEERRRALNLDSVKPYDTVCDRFGRDPLHPFEDGDELAAGCRTIFAKIDPESVSYTHLRAHET